MRRNALLRTLALAFWAAMTFWLLRYEAFPEFFTHTLSGYEALLDRSTLISDTWMRILHNGAPIGYCRTNVDLDEFNTVRHVQVDHRVNVNMDVLGQTQPMFLQGQVHLDVMYQLQHFTFALSSAALQIKVEGERAEGNLFHVQLDTGGATNELRVAIPDDVVLYSPMAVMALKKLRVGEQIKIQTLNPITLSTADALVRALRKETLELADGPVETTVLAVEYLGSELQSWVDREGTIVRQETPFGWALERCTPEQAIEAARRVPAVRERATDAPAEGDAT